MSFSLPADDPDGPGRAGSSRATAHRAPRRRRRSPLSITVGALVVLALALVILSEVVTRYLWFDQLGYDRVLVTQWITQGILFVLGGIVFAVPLWLSLRHAYHHRPLHPPVTREDEAQEQFRTAIEPLRRAVTVLAPLILGAFAGLAAARGWQEVLLALHPERFGTVDPIFGFDAGFYVFTLPLIDMALAFARFACLIALIGALVGHFVYGGITWHQGEGTPSLEITRQARRRLGLLAVIYLLILGLSHWFERYGLLTGSHARFDGASYTDVHAILPAKAILAIAAVIVAVLFAVWMVRGDWRIPAIGAAGMLLSTLAVGVAYPWLIQQFQVQPNERSLERTFIQHNINATRAAYGLEDVDVVDYKASSSAAPGALRADAETTAQIRILDPAVVAPTFGQREANRRYWGFDSPLSVDRYQINGKLQDTVLGVRELSPTKLDLDELSWVNQHITYTHGFGVAAAYGNRRNADGEPAFLESGVPGTGALGEYEQRVYFGRQSPVYSIVGAARGAAPEEFDYQSGTDGSSAGSQVSNSFSGDGGPSLSNPFVRLLYAIRFRDPNILISSYVNEHSQILYDRSPQQRVRAVAPFLSLDSGMYPAVVDGRLVWVIDAFTSTDRYPYSQRASMDTVVRDSQTDPTGTTGLRASEVNYLRNGVKATVDAYDGKVTLYAWDTKDPILKSWRSIFPGQIKDTSSISGDLMAHLRYPEDMFKAQRTLLARYHVTDPAGFYGQQDFWQVPGDPTAAAAKNPDGTAGARPDQPPHYLTLEMPGQGTPRFSLSSSYIPANGQDVLAGFLSVDSETGSKPGAPASSYGKLTLLNLPSSNPVNGPGQVQNAFTADQSVSKALNLLKSGNSEVINGNLLTLPVGGGLLYVQPVYLQSSTAGGGSQYPLLQMVLVAFGDKIGFASTLDEALDQVFAGDSGASAGDSGVPATGESGAKDTSGSTPSASQPASGDAHARLKAALTQMQTAETDSQAALAKGDWTAYGQAQKRLQDGLQQAVAAQKEIEAAGGSSGSTPAPSDGGGG